MTTTTWRSAAFAGAAGIVTLVALAGCAGGGAVQAEPTTGSTHSAASAAPATEASTASGPTTASAATGGDGTSSGTGSLRSGACTATHLHGSLTTAVGGGSAGHQAYEIVFRNTGASPCTLQGWPGVSFVGKGDGTQLGAPATFDRSSAHGTVTIAAGSTAHATLLLAEARNYEDCGITTADGFRVYPPGSKQSLFVDAGQLELSACTASGVEQLQVQAVQPGS
ncbi:DUF4232 domain-containing protein [Curtobacterium luteum]|uniref:DUF4232 domain-containing protein n=1 Tax=Curtobacterium luteum TaxID=33881 RepID=A0A175RNS3_9MICO|nr:DUF4232 domain-containing protein [Curtobacterium luteum]KTR05297.1 hypothetical protein NS184_10495 [Curtobacterium luteum]